MYFLIFGCIIFFAVHLYSAFRSRDPIRDVRVSMGAAKFKGLYSLFAGLGFILMIFRLIPVAIWLRLRLSFIMTFLLVALGLILR